MSGIYGLSGSGMDVDTLVKGLMKGQQMKYDKLKQQKTVLEWKKADYSAIYQKFSDFRNTAFSFKMQGSLNPKSVSSTSESVATASANASAANVTHSLTVTKLAKGATATSTAAITTKVGATKDTLANQFDLSGLTGLEGYADGKFTITLKNGTASKDITVDTSKSINELVSSINNAGVNVKASYDATVDRFFLYSGNSGAAATIDFSGSSAAGQAFLQDNLKVGLTAQGQDAKFTLDGAVDLTQSSNSFTISGVSYTLKGEGTTSVGVATDTDKAVSAVKSFVDSYNSLLETVNGKLNETYYKDFAPLTDEQRSEMKDEEITAWEKKAKSGLLRGDSMLRDIVMQLRQNVSAPVTGTTSTYKTLASIGITTGAYTENGKLYLDETKLKAALEADPDVLTNLFATNGDSTSADGVAMRLYDSMKTAMDKVFAQAGISDSISGDTKSALAKLIRTKETQMTEQQERMETIEDRYYKQFNAMESMLQQMNTQSSWLSQQFSTGTSA